MIFIDVLTVKAGKTAADAAAYFDKAAPVLAKHGFRRLKMYEVTNKMRGHNDISPSVVQIWETPGPSGFQAMGADPDYQALVPTRDATFDMGAMQGWFAKEA